jgi:hypothetical protein
LGGAGLFLSEKYKGDPLLLFSAIYPDFQWKSEKFVHFKDVNHRIFMDWAGKQLKMKEMKDWYKVTPKVIRCFSNKVRL